MKYITLFELLTNIGDFLLCVTSCMIISVLTHSHLTALGDTYI